MAKRPQIILKEPLKNIFSTAMRTLRLQDTSVASVLSSHKKSALRFAPCVLIRLRRGFKMFARSVRISSRKSVFQRFLGITAIAAVALTACGDPIGAKYVGFAECITQKGAKMYGTYRCPHCNNQKAMFGKEGAKKLNYIECDPNGKNANPWLCQEKGIDGYPTWEFADGQRITGEITMEVLSRKTGCKLPP